MIITVTMNPAVDRTVEIDRLLHGGLNRIEKAEYDVGGKGINVSKTLKALGGESIATGFLGGRTGKLIEDALHEKGIRTDFIYVEGETRTNTKVCEENGVLTELNEPGPQVNESRVEALLEKMADYAKEGVLFVLSGSVPRGVDKHIYARMIRIIHEKGAEVLLDAGGELLKNGLMEKPDMMKPNRAELEEYADLKRAASKEELLNLARAFNRNGIEKVVVSMGEEGALFILGEYEAFSPALSVRAQSPVGAGDAMVAALAYAWDKKLTEEETLRLCMAAAAGAVTTEGTKPPDKMLVDKLARQVVIEGREG